MSFFCFVTFIIWKWNRIPFKAALLPTLASKNKDLNILMYPVLCSTLTGSPAGVVERIARNSFGYFKNLHLLFEIQKYFLNN